jgi:hypothetical protein
MQKDLAEREEMFSMIRDWQQSGLSQKAYCEQHNVRYHVFHYWYKCFRQVQLPAKEEGFIALNVQAACSANTLCAEVELLLADGRRVIFHQPVSIDYLKALIS